ncbi:MAG: SDR family oxidoreductase [Myxococcales bacterium]|nr:SDR family oxidoreductase [Myxococcales bacterium]
MPHPIFANKVAIVTGAASGIGLETTRQLAAAGAIVIAADRDAEGLKAAEANNVHTAVLDVTDTEAFRKLIDDTAAEHGHIDYLFNNAGIAGKAGEVRDLVPADWQRMVDINLLSVVHGASFAYAHMRKRGSGHIVNMASAAGLLGTPTMIPYSVTKAAVVAFSRDFRSEAAGFGVNVTVLCPGFIESKIFENAEGGPVDIQALKKRIPFKFVATDRAVSRMLIGVAKNRPIVTLPGYIDLLWWLRRSLPRTFDRILGRRSVADFRAIRKDDNA